MLGCRKSGTSGTRDSIWVVGDRSRVRMVMKGWNEEERE